MSVPARLAADTEQADLPAGSDERFAGYGVMGLPFASGHVLAMRRFPASSIGPAYTSVWHREPDRTWVFWQDQQDDQSCPRYFSAALSQTRRVDIQLSWPADSTLRVVLRSHAPGHLACPVNAAPQPPSTRSPSCGYAPLMCRRP